MSQEVEFLGDPEPALEIMTGPDTPPIALIDWPVPVRSGVDLCRRVRVLPEDRA